MGFLDFHYSFLNFVVDSSLKISSSFPGYDAFKSAIKIHYFHINIFTSISLKFSKYAFKIISLYRNIKDSISIFNFSSNISRAIDKTYINKMMLNPRPKEIIPNKEKAFSIPID